MNGQLFVSRKAFLADLTFAAAANRGAVGRFAGIDDFRRSGVADRTMQKFFSGDALNAGVDVLGNKLANKKKQRISCLNHTTSKMMGDEMLGFIKFLFWMMGRAI